MAKLTERKRKWIIGQKNKMPKKDIASAMNVSRTAIWKVEQKYNKFGKGGLKTQKPGRRFQPLNPKFYKLLVEEWRKNKCWARKLHAVMKRKGFDVSRRKIEQVLITEGFQKRL